MQCYNINSEVYMNKICCLIMCSSLLAVCVSACTIKKDEPLIKSQRRLEKYIQPIEQKDSNVIDLSEGPKLKYEANFGPQTPSFDFKIVNPY